MSSWSRLLPSANGIPRSLAPREEKTKLPSRVFQAVLFLAALTATFVYSTWALQQRSVSYFDQGRAGHSLKPKHGLLVLGNATGLRHPILTLIARGERLWQEKLDQQSTTLAEAYHEYRRRYNRKPPIGFDIWFKWCQDRNVKLLDEYDQVNHDMKKLWASSPEDLRAAQAELEHRKDTYTLGKTTADADVSILTHNMTAGYLEWSGTERAKRQMNLIVTFKKFLPAFRMTWSLHDAPQMFITWEMREAVENALGRGHYVDLSTVNSSGTGWSSGCPPGTPLNPSSATPAEALTPGKSFIADLRASMDPCYNTELIKLSTLGDYPAGVKPANKLYPAMSRAKTELHADIVAPTIEGWADEDDDVPWEKKEDHHALWRGRTTGREFAPTWEDWKTGQRLRLDDITNAHSGTVSVLPPPTSDNNVMPPTDWDAKTINEYWFDVGIIDTVQCPPDFCQKIKDGYVFKGGAGGDVEKHHKFIIDVDGNSWSSRFRRLMQRKSVVFKSTVYPEWWTDRSMPWVHYVPIKMDFSDMHDAMAFFRGLPDGTPGRDDLAQRIGDAGRDWVNQYWRIEDVIAYTWRLYLEFVRVTSENREAMDFTLPEAAKSVSLGRRWL